MAIVKMLHLFQYHDALKDIQDAIKLDAENEESYYGNLRNKLYNFFIENGVILRPVGNIVYIIPPYIITENQLQKVYQTIENAIEIV